jgi:NAD(P)-dependent dehydrogenase (short-subunit alcohol dehydrogenase family)
MGQLEGRVAIVTGGGQGIGRGIARRFAREGARVVVAERDRASGETTAAELGPLGGEGRFVAVDVAEEAQVRAMVADAVGVFGRVDVLVNNAWGGGTFSRLEHKTGRDMEHGFRVGLMASFWSMQAAFPHMRAQRYGRIVNLCSLNGVNAHMYTVEYNTAKEGLRALSRTAAREWARHGITVNVICPAAATAAYRAFVAAAPENAAELLAQNPMGRMGDPEDDIGPVALFLAGEESRYLTGNTLFVDGGSHINGVAWAPELPD